MFLILDEPSSTEVTATTTITSKEIGTEIKIRILAYTYCKCVSIETYKNLFQELL